MRSVLVVVTDVIIHQAFQVTFIENNHVAEQITTSAANASDSLQTTLPKLPRSGKLRSIPHHLPGQSRQGSIVCCYLSWAGLLALTRSMFIAIFRDSRASTSFCEDPTPVCISWSKLPAIKIQTLTFRSFTIEKQSNMLQETTRKRKTNRFDLLLDPVDCNWMLQHLQLQLEISVPVHGRRHVCFGPS